MDERNSPTEERNKISNIMTALDLLLQLEKSEDRSLEQ